jgi:hypothetical protein
MKLDRWKISWGVSLIFLSVIFYVIHFMVFRDPHHLFIFLVGDIAFVFIEVLLVTMILHEPLNFRDKRDKLYKLNMVIGAFFSEVGTELLRLFSDFDHNADAVRDEFVACHTWPDQKFTKTSKECQYYNYSIDSQKGNLEALRAFLLDKRNFLLNLLQNPTLLEHDTFSDLLWTVFHLTEELVQRDDVEDLADVDYNHIAIDIERAYILLTSQWLAYMKHLKSDYPYLYSLAIRTNPFNPEVSVEIKE